MQLFHSSRVSYYMNAAQKLSAPLGFPFYSIREEIANSILHGIGTLAATAGMVLLTLKAGGFLGGKGSGSLDIVAVLLFTVTMIGMYLISTLYHAIQHRGIKRLMRKLDHSVIFIFIAGTYSPLCLSGLGGIWGWSIFAVEWAMAFTGIALNIAGYKHIHKIEIAIYIIMGWAIVAGMVPLIRSVPVICVILLFSGGIAYTMGVFWYRKKNIRMTHAIWHAFVMAGTTCHWFSMWYLI